LTERNFLGLGHEFQNDFINRFKTDQHAYKAKYTISNIRNTYINTTLQYENSLNNYTTKSIRIERPFFSPYTKMAGGVYFRKTILCRFVTRYASVSQTNDDLDLTLKIIGLGVPFGIQRKK